VYDFSKFKSDSNNWFKFIATSNTKLDDFATEFLSSPKLVPFSSIVETQRVDLGYLKFKDFHGFVLYDKTRAKKNIDVWVAEKVTKNKVMAEHKIFRNVVEIPVQVLGRGLRRLVNIIDVSEKSDYLILSWFDGIQELARPILSEKDLPSLKSDIESTWKKKFEIRKSNLLIARRFDISAPGTSLLAFYSDKPLVGVNMWSAKEINEEFSKILALWFNSSMGIIQFLLRRIEARGAWMTIHDYMFDEILAPNFKKLSDKDKELLKKTYNEVKNVEFPSILDQLKHRHPARKLIDQAWLEILGYRGDKEKLLDELYRSLADEIELLKKMMAEGAQQIE
jgi:hypothetical protein